MDNSCRYPDDLDDLNPTTDDGESDKEFTSRKLDRTVDDGDLLTSDSDEDYRPNKNKNNRLNPLTERICKLVSKVQLLSSDSIWQPCKSERSRLVESLFSSAGSSGMMWKSGSKRSREVSSDDSQTSHDVKKKKKRRSEEVNCEVDMHRDSDNLSKKHSTQNEVSVRKYPHLLSSESEASPKRKKRSSDKYSRNNHEVSDTDDASRRKKERKKHLHLLSGDDEKSSKKRKKSHGDSTMNYNDASENDHIPEINNSVQEELTGSKKYPHLLSSEGEESPKGKNRINVKLMKNALNLYSSGNETYKRRLSFANEGSAMKENPHLLTSENKSSLNSKKRNSDVHSSKVKRKAISHSMSGSDSEQSSESHSKNKKTEVEKVSSVYSGHSERPSTSKHKETGHRDRSSGSHDFERPSTSAHKETISDSASSSDSDNEKSSTSKHKETKLKINSSEKQQLCTNGSSSKRDPADDVEMETDVNVDHDVSSQSDLEIVHNVRNKSSKSRPTAVPKSSSVHGSQDLEESYVEHVFTEEDEDNISKFSILLDENLLEENNLWLMQCPTDMDCSRLVGQYLTLEGDSQLEAGDVRYETFGIRGQETRSISLAVPSRGNHMKIRNLPIMGDIIMEESIPVGSQAVFKVPEDPVSVRLPAGLRTRHPLLGTDLENQPRTPLRVKKEPKDRISGVYEDMSESSESPQKRKKKKKKSRDSFTDQSAVESDFSSAEVSHKKKKKKHKDSEGPAISAVESDFSSAEVTHKKKKRKHKDSEGPANSFDPDLSAEGVVKRKKKKKHRNDETSS